MKPIETIAEYKIYLQDYIQELIDLKISILKNKSQNFSLSNRFGYQTNGYLMALNQVLAIIKGK